MTPTRKRLINGGGNPEPESINLDGCTGSGTGC